MPFDKAATALPGARQIVFGGTGASGHVADDSCNKFFRLGIPCVALTSMPGLLQYSATLTNADSLILISHSGRWPELLRVANLALPDALQVALALKLGEAAVDQPKRSKAALL